MKSFLEFIGIEPVRYQIAWISGSEGQKFADTMTRVIKKVKAAGPNTKLREARTEGGQE